MPTQRTLIISFIIVAAAMSRLIPHPPNVTPVLALGLFAGREFLPKSFFFYLPIAVMALSDLFIGYHISLPVVYGALLLCTFVGAWLKHRSRLTTVVAGGVASSVLFYLITNFGVWILNGMYPKTWAGLVTCYAAAIPFFQNTLLSTMGYAVVLLYGMKVVENFYPAARASVAEA